jgi:anti-anti-sigma factor
MEQNDFRQCKIVRESTAYGAVVHVVGVVDFLSTEAFETGVIDAEPAAGPLTIDFSKCAYIDSAGISVLIRARRRLGPRLRLRINEGSIVLRVLRISQLDRVFEIVNGQKPTE